MQSSLEKMTFEQRCNRSERSSYAGIWWKDASRQSVQRPQGYKDTMLTGAMLSRNEVREVDVGGTGETRQHKGFFRSQKELWVRKLGVNDFDLLFGLQTPKR